MHFTATQVDLLSSAIVNASVLIIGAMGTLVVALLVYAGRKFTALALKVEGNTVKIDTQAVTVHDLGNSGGDRKIEAVINSKIIDGTLQKGRNNELTRATDRPVIGSDSTQSS